MEEPGRSDERESRWAGAADVGRRLIDRRVLAALAIQVALAIVDIGTGRGTLLTSAYLLPVLALAVVENGERTAALAVVGVLLALGSGVWNDYFLTGAHLYRLAIVAGGGLFGTLGAVFRHRAVVAHDQIATLAQIGEIADGTSQLDVALERLAGLLVPTAADACTLTVFEAGRPRRVASRADDPRKAALIAGLPDEAPPEAIQAVRSGEASLIRRFTGWGTRATNAPSSQALAVMSRTRMTSAAFVPVRAAEETLALLVLGVGPSGRRYGPLDLRFARTVGSRAGLAIQNSRLLAALRESEQRLEAIVGSLADAVTIRDLSGRVIYANDAARLAMGLDAEEDVGRLDPLELYNRFLVTDERGDPIELDRLPSVRLLAGEEPEPLVMRVVDPRQGEERWRLLKATPLYDSEGRLEAAVTIIEDITPTKRAQLRSAFLSQASAVLAGSLDYQQTLANVAWLAVPEIADWCAVDLVDERGERQQVVAAHRDPRKLELAQQLREREPAELNPDEGLGLVLRTGEPLVYSEIPAGLVEQAARDEEHLRMLRELQMHSGMVVPMRGATRILGAMTLVSAESGRRFNRDDLGFAEQLAARAAIAVENAQLYSERARIAATLQHSLLPEALPAIDGWELASLYRPASPDGIVEVGGDFYDAFPSQRGWMILIGDVTGKGVEAAAMTSLVRHGARFVADYQPDPVEVLARLDRSLRQQGNLSLCTALCLRIDADRITFASAGHPLPLLVTDDGVHAVGSPGAVLGAFADGSWAAETIVLRPNEVLLLYTDGVTDTVGEPGRFGEQRLLRTVAECGPLAPEELLHCLDVALNEFQVGAQADDTAALALRLAGRPAQARLPAIQRGGS